MKEKIFRQDHLLGIEQLSVDDIEIILETAEAFIEVSSREVKKVPALKGKTVVNLFFENSTRTRSSFEIAAKRLSADLINFNSSISSLKKGETLKDTVLTLEAMNPHIIVIRHSASGSPHYLTTFARSSIINAGDGFHEHPTQALLDALTIQQRLKTLRGLKIAIVGDILHSRVARSNILLHQKMGNEIALIGPPSLVPREFEKMGAQVYYDIRRGVRGADAVDDAARPGRAGRQELFPLHPRIPQPLRHQPRDLRPGKEVGHPDAPGTDQPRRGDRDFDGRFQTVGDPAAGDQRHRRAHGRPVPLKGEIHEALN